MIIRRITNAVIMAIFGIGLAVAGPEHDNPQDHANDHAHDTTGIHNAPAHSGSVSEAASSAPADLCRHTIDRARCPFCLPDVIEQMGWCAGHARPEAFCTLCNAYLIPAYKALDDWCAGHDLPESQCVLCNGDPVQARFEMWRVMFGGGDEASASELGLASQPRSQRAPNVWCTKQDLLVTLAGEDTVRAAGLTFAPVERRRVTETVKAPARLDYNRNAFARVTPRAPGPIAEVRSDLGDRVEQGDVLCVIDSAELGEAKTAFLRAHALEALARRDHEREQDLLTKGVSAEKSALDMEAAWVVARHALSGARQKLRNLGLSDAQIEDVLATGDTSSLLPVAAPLTGVVVERQAVQGEVAAMDRPLFAVADLSTLWAEIDVFETDAPAVRTGQPVVFAADGRLGDRAAGELEWVSPQLDVRTRTLRARASLPNSEGALRAGTFGQVEIRVHSDELALVVPKEAVQWEGCCNVVFVRESPAAFRPRKVALGYEGENFFVVAGGVSEGEMTVAQGSFLLKTEILKGSIGAGCCEVDKPR